MVCKRKKQTKNKIVSTHISILSHFTLNVDFILETECVDQHQHQKNKKKPTKTWIYTFYFYDFFRGQASLIHNVVYCEQLCI